MDIALATSQNIRANRADRRAAEMQERELFERRRRDQGIEAAAEQFGDVAYAPTVFGQAQGVEQRGVRFENEQDDRQRELRTSAMRNALSLAAMGERNGQPPEQQAERAAAFLGRMGYDEGTIGQATEMIASGQMPASQVLESVFGEEQRRAEYSGLQEVAGPDGQQMYVREVVQPDGTRAFVDVQGNPVENFSPYEAPRRSTGQTWETLDPDDPRAVRAGISGRGYQISDRGNIRRIPGTAEGAGRNQMFGADARARIATNLPALQRAFGDMRGLLGEGIRFRTGDDFVSQGRNITASLAEQFIPWVGDDIGRQLDTDDRQLLRQAADTYSGALQPIMSGAAVTDSEANRNIRASIPTYGDSDEVLAIKMAQMNAMNSVFQRALNGENVDFSDVGRELRDMERIMRREMGLPEDESITDGVSGDPFTMEGDIAARAAALDVEMSAVESTARRYGITPAEVLDRLEG